jgi:hypothetical protein
MNAALDQRHIGNKLFRLTCPTGGLEATSFAYGEMLGRFRQVACNAEASAGK